MLVREPPLTLGLTGQTSREAVLRVVHLGKYYPPATGGIETHVQTLARAQIELGAEVRVLVVNHAADDGHDATFDRFVSTPDAEDWDGRIRIHRAGRVANVAKLDVSPTLPGLLNRVWREFRPDVWHLHTPNVTTMLAVLANSRVRPLVVTHHSDIVRQKVLGKLFRPFEISIYRRAAKILPTSPPYVEGSDLLRRFRNKVEPLALGLDLTPYLHPSPAALEHAAVLRNNYPGPIWLSVGRLIYYKALHVAIRALQSVSGTLLAIGTGPMADEWRWLAAELGVSDRVVWLGRVSDDELVGAYHAATAMWFPSNARSEAYGLVQVEAMASGCPVINCDIPASGVPWVCPDGMAGLTVPPDDVEAFARAANRLLGDRALRDRLSAGARFEAVARFEATKMAEASLQIYATATRCSR